MGDFNTIPNTKPILVFKEELSESSKIAIQKSEKIKGTFNGFKPNAKLNVRIDYVFTHNLKVLSYKHIKNKRENNLWISDHLPVLVEVE